MPSQLVIQLARFGDLVQTKRLLASLLADAENEVHLCLDESLAPLARLVYPGAVLHPVCAHGTAVARLSAGEQAAVLLGRNMPAFRELAAIPFERVYNLNFSPLNYRVASLFDPDTVRGHVWRSGQEIVGQWARLAMRWSALRRAGINIADFWAWHLPRPFPAERVNPPAEGRGGGLGVVMAGRESRRSLPPQVLAGLVSALLDLRGDSAVTLLGSRAESAAARQMERHLPARHARILQNRCGATDWAVLVDTVAGLDLVLTPDTGTMHLAAHLGVPVLATFLSSAWCFETGPYGSGHTVLQANVDCGPCLESAPCGLDLYCLRAFEDEDLVRFLSTRDPAHLPEGLSCFASGFDALGVTYSAQAGNDPQAELRHGLRAVLAGHLRAGQTSPTALEHSLAERLYGERDWLCPDPESVAGRFGLDGSIFS